VRNETNELVDAAMTSSNLLSMLDRSDCVVSFEVDDLPQVRFYALEIGTHEGPAYSFDDLISQDWGVALSLGDSDETAFSKQPQLLCDTAADLNTTLNTPSRISDDTRAWYRDVLKASNALKAGGRIRDLGGCRGC
jgi:hypothetical protein